MLEGITIPHAVPPHLARITVGALAVKSRLTDYETDGVMSSLVTQRAMFSG